MRPIHIIVTCEHAGNKIPDEYAELFKGANPILKSHRGWDIGALSIAKRMSRKLASPIHWTEISRLLVECNRSIGNVNLFSSFTADLKKQEQQEILKKYYFPYRNEVLNAIAASVDQITVLHLSIHTFTPIMNSMERKMDVGLLFDDKRAEEALLCQHWLTQLHHGLDAVVALNQPYHGADDGFTTYLRTQFEPDEYLGIEIEVNQKWVGHPFMKEITGALIKSLLESLPLAEYNFQLPEKKQLSGTIS